MMNKVIAAERKSDIIVKLEYLVACQALNMGNIN